MNDIQKKAELIAKEFVIKGNLVKIKANTQGHINSTFVSTFEDEGRLVKYTHQRINKNVFPHPDEVMANIVRVTEHIKAKLGDVKDKDKRCLEVVLTHSGKPYYIDEEGEYWRTYRFIEDVATFDKVPGTREAYNLGQGIGIFETQLSDFDGASLFTTIPRFHDMRMRYGQLEDAIKNDRAGRLASVKEEVDFLLENKERGAKIWDGFENGTLPTRVTHNDTKMNNVLFSEDEGKALCVIDLDTIMPGTILFDTGDMIRTACANATEDEKDITKVTFNIDYYKALTEGYVTAATFLTEKEKSLIKESGRTITQIMAVRFLTDYINGDVYYSIAYPEHNIVRARNQIKLMKSMDEQWNLF